MDIRWQPEMELIQWTMVYCQSSEQLDFLAILTIRYRLNLYTKTPTMKTQSSTKFWNEEEEYTKFGIYFLPIFFEWNYRTNSVKFRKKFKIQWFERCFEKTKMFKICCHLSIECLFRSVKYEMPWMELFAQNSDKTPASAHLLKWWKKQIGKIHIFIHSELFSFMIWNLRASSRILRHVNLEFCPPTHCSEWERASSFSLL